MVYKPFQQQLQKMKKILSIICFLLLTSCYPSPQNHLQSTVVVIGYQDNQVVSQGSGVITKYGILTAAHVIKQTDSVQVRYYDKTKRSVTVKDKKFQEVGTTVKQDIALLSQPKENVKTATIQCSPVSIQEQVYAVGHPHRMSWVITKGNITSTHPRKMQQQNAWIQTDAVFSRGSSGGPVFNRFGKVVGIISHLDTVMVQRKPTFTGFGFAVSGQKICSFVGKKQIERSSRM